MAEACIVRVIRPPAVAVATGWRPADPDHGDLAGDEASRSMPAGGGRLVNQEEAGMDAMA